MFPQGVIFNVNYAPELEAPYVEEVRIASSRRALVGASVAIGALVGSVVVDSGAPDYAYASASLTLPSGEQEMSTTFQDLCAETCQLSGFGATDEVRLVVTSSNGAGLTGKVRLTPGTVTTGLEAVTGYNGGDAANLTADSYSELAFVGTQAEINAVLPELQYKGNARGDTETVSISATLAGVDGRTLHYFPGTGHYYEFVEADTDWATARDQAALRTFNGLSGYLVTILTEEENNFIEEKITNPTLWMGATFTPDGGGNPPFASNTAGTWQWVTGPASEQVEFWSGTEFGSPVAGRYANWDTNQPDGSAICAVTNYSGAGKWDDFGCDYSNDYLVEFGGLPDESPTLELTTSVDVYVPYLVTFDENSDQHQNGVVTGQAPADVLVKPGTVYTLPGNTGSLARQGFTFEGWDTSSAWTPIAGSDNSIDNATVKTSITVNADTTVYAQWRIPRAARLFGQTDSSGNRSEMVKDVVDYPGAESTARVRGITNDGEYVYYLPSRAPSNDRAEIFRVHFGSSDESIDNQADFDQVFSVVDDPDRPGGVAALNGVTALRDLAYSSGCIFIRGGSSPSFTQLYCVDITRTNSNGEWIVYDVTPTTTFPAGDLYLTGNILDFETGEIATVGKNREANADPNCPAGFDCKVLRIYDVTGAGSTVSVTHKKDVLLADSESTTDTCSYAVSGWPCDNHGVASDGTYFFQSNHEFGYRTWALPQGNDVVGYLVFNGDGLADLDGVGGTARQSDGGGHNADCGADNGTSGGFCPINPEKDGVDRSTWDKTTDRQMINTTFFSRDHSSKRYIMGDFEAPRFLLTLAATDQPASEFSQPKPSVPSSVAATAGNQSATVRWTASAVTGDGTISYTVTASPGGNTCTTTTTSCTVSGLTNGTTYTFSVVASVASVISDAGVSAGIIPAVPASNNGGSQANDDDENDGESTTATPPPSISGGGATRGVTPTRPGPATPPQMLNGPVNLPGNPGGNQTAPGAWVGGVPTPTQTTVAGGGVLITSGTLSVGLTSPTPGSGAVEENPESGYPELRMVQGGSTRLSGGGLAPGSMVQVWLPGVLNRELGRVSVGPDGRFDGEIAFTHRLDEDPLPIGRRTLQVTGFDIDGVETVVEMVVNIAQPPPTPEPNRLIGALPDLSPLESIATSAGLPTPAIVTPFSQQRRVEIDGGEWAFSLVINDPDGEVSGASNEAFVRVNQSSTNSVQGSGLQPGTVASVWMFSEPTLLGSVTVTEEGEFSVDVMVDARFIPAGEHTLQIQGVGEDGFIKAANLGVLVDVGPVPTTASSASMLLWWILALVGAALAVIVAWGLRRRSQRQI